MSTVTPRERRHQRTKDAILEASRQIIREAGADGLSMREIAKRIDYSPAGLYEYFGSKDEIIKALCHQGHSRLTARMTTIDTALPADKYLVEIGKAYIAFALQNAEQYLMMFTNPAFAGSPAQIEEDESSLSILLATIQRGLDEGIFVSKPDFGQLEMAYAAWSLVHGISMLRLTSLTEYPFDFAAADEQAINTLVDGLKE